jgi:glutamate synthase (NADPH/NADH) large chain
MTGGTVVILGEVGDNFGAGMTGGIAFVYDPKNQFEKRVNSETVIWQSVETKYWINYLKKLVEEHFNETNSLLAKKIFENFNAEMLNFLQICPKEMINKLENPISLKSPIKEVI